MILLFAAPRGEAQLWTSIGPTAITGSSGPTGRITALAVDPTDADHWLLGAAGGGVWESRDAGRSWTPLTDSQPTLSTGSVAFAPSNPQVIYVGTGEANYINYAQAGLGILKSTDGGSSWSMAGATTFARTSVGVIRVDPADPDVAIAVMSRGFLGRNNDRFLGTAGPPPFGVQRTTDGGLRWTRTLSGESTAIEIDPANFNNQYAAVTLPTGFGPYNPPDPSGIYRSSDGGKTWSIIRGPWSEITTGRILLAMAPSDRNTLYASIQGPDRSLYGLFRTNNAWSTAPDWIRVSTSGNWSSGGVNYPDYCGNNCTATHVLAVDPEDANTLYAGGSSLWRCDNCGENPNWTDIGSSIPTGKRCLAWSGARLIVCTDGGLFSTTTRDAPWRNDNAGLSVVRFTSGVLHPTDANSGVAGTLDSGFLRWTGSAWQRVGNFPGDVALSREAPARNLMGSRNSLIFRSITGGATFGAADSGFDSAGYNSALLPVRKCPTNDDIFLSGTVRLQKSNNFFSGNPATWTANAPAAGEAITAIAFAESDRSCGTYVYGTTTGRLFLTGNGGGTWRDLDPGRAIPSRAIQSLAFDPTSAGTLYVALASVDSASSRRGHLFKSKNTLSSAPTWTDISPGADLPHNVVAVDPSDTNSIYVGTDAGVWHTKNGGSGWQLLGPATGLPNSPVYDLKIDAGTGRIIAFTFGRGAWSLDHLGIPPLGRPPSLSGNTSLHVAIGKPYSLQFGTAGNSFSWALAAGTLPTGLALTDTGQIVGTPLQAGTFTFRVLARDGAGGAASQTYTLVVASNLESPVWTNIGPYSLVQQGFRCVSNHSTSCLHSGRVSSIAVNPTDPKHWLVGFGNGGIWESRDAGSLWRPIADDAATLTIGAVAFAPSNPDIIYAGTGEATGVGMTHAGDGMLRSSDGGKTWTLLAASSFARAAVRRIQVDPSNPNIVLATVSRGGYGRDAQTSPPGAPPYGVLRSTDGGATWTRTLTGLATSLEVDSSNFSNQYAAIGDGRINFATGGAGNLANGVYRSTDGGQTWSLIPGPWGNVTQPGPSFGRIELAISPSNPNVLYAGFAKLRSAPGLFGLYRTDNAWAPSPSWIRIPELPTWIDGYCGPDKCDYAHILSVDPSDADTLFAGGGSEVTGMWRCGNCRTSPEWIAVGGGHADQHALSWAGKQLVVGNDGGVWSMDNSGVIDRFQSHNDALPTALFYSGALHPTDPNVILGGLRDFGPSLRTQSNNWLLTFLSGPNPVHWGEAEVALSATRPETDWMVASNWGQIYRTIDGAKTGTPAHEGIDTSASAFVAPVRKCASDDDIFLTGTNRVWRTDNFFTSTNPTWVPNSPAGVPNSRFSPVTILSIAFAPSDTTCSTYAYGTLGGQIHLTRDGGKTWKDLDPSRTIPGRGVNGLAFDPVDANVLYAGVSGFNDGTPGKPGHVFKSTNTQVASPSWINISPPQDQPFNVIAIDPINPKLVFAGSDAGLWRSNDAGQTWIRQGADVGMPNATVHDIQINPRTGRTVVFTYGRSAYALGPELISISPSEAATHPAGVAVPGSWARVQGTNLAGESRVWKDEDFTATDGKLPTILSGVEVKVNGTPAAICSISPSQIIFQMPESTSGSATVQVFRDGVPSNVI